MRKKVCKNCRAFVDGDICPKCKGNQFSANWQGRINVLDASNSAIAKKVNINSDGEYAVKFR